MQDSRGREEQYPTRYGNCFPLGRGLFFSRKMVAIESRYTLALKVLQLACPHLSSGPPSLDSPSTTAVHASFPLLGAQVTGCGHKICVLAPLRVKGKKIMALSPARFVFLQQRKTLKPFTARCWVVSWSLHCHTPGLVASLVDLVSLL